MMKAEDLQYIYKGYTVRIYPTSSERSLWSVKAINGIDVVFQSHYINGYNVARNVVEGWINGQPMIGKEATDGSAQ